MQATSKCCGTCKYFQVAEYEPDEPTEEAKYGACTWDTFFPLPESLRYGTREKTGMYEDEGKTCQQWKR